MKALFIALWGFIRENKMYFLIPFFAVLFLLLAFIFFGEKILPGVIIYTF